MANSKLNLILASASPRRKELLGHLKIPFQVLTLNIPEESSEADPAAYTLEIAKMKGQAVLAELKLKRPGESFLVVSADTEVALGSKIYGKPSDRDEARRFLEELSGRGHCVSTAVAALLWHEGSLSGFSFVDESKVTFEKIGSELMERYLDTGDSLDKAGAYGIQNGSLSFISKVEGSYSTVVGFPLSRFVMEAERFLKLKFPEEASWFNLF